MQSWTLKERKSLSCNLAHTWMPIRCSLGRAQTHIFFVWKTIILSTFSKILAYLHRLQRGRKKRCLVTTFSFSFAQVYRNWVIATVQYNGETVWKMCSHWISYITVSCFHLKGLIWTKSIRMLLELPELHMWIWFICCSFVLSFPNFMSSSFF